jgi:Acetyltransferase (GNAT) domain
MDRTWSGAGDTVPGMQQTRAAPPATLEAVLERITYANQETGYTVARVATARSSDLLTVVGPLLGAQPGEGLRLRGRWASHPQYGRQFQAEDSRQAEIGFTLAPQHQGYGYATEAVRRPLHYLLVERGKHRVRATCDDRNTSSAAVLERVGMRREGHLLGGC